MRYSKPESVSSPSVADFLSAGRERRQFGSTGIYGVISGRMLDFRMLRAYYYTDTTELDASSASISIGPRGGKKNAKRTTVFDSFCIQHWFEWRDTEQRLLFLGRYKWQSGSEPNGHWCLLCVM